MRALGFVLPAILVVAGVGAMPAFARGNLLPNGGFENGLTGWYSSSATLSPTSTAHGGSAAAHVANNGGTSFTIAPTPRPVSSVVAGDAYATSAWIRSSTPGHTVCLRIREWNGGTLRLSGRACGTSTTSWQLLQISGFAVSTSGDSLDVYLYESSAGAGDSFDVDDVALANGSGADTTPPDTTITSGPSGTTTSTSAQFAFASTESGSSFRCALDGAAAASCSPPQSYSSLADGSHTFSVAAVDAAGNLDPTPATRTWTISTADTTPPDTTITSGPSGTTTSTTAQFAFASTESGSSFTCALDGAAAASCTSPQSYSVLAAGSHTFSVAAVDPAGNQDQTPATWTWTVAAPSGDPVLALAGDQHACEGPGASQTAGLLGTLAFDAVASLGDASGNTGSASEYANCYDPTWGTWKSITHPAIGNHDYGSGDPNGEGYFGYFGAAAGQPGQGYYSFDLGTWHVVVLNSYCGKVTGGGCGLGSAQVAWLKQDLAAHPVQCTLALWHHPLFTSSPQPGTSGSPAGLYKTLYNYGADLVVNAHVRMYERFAPQDPYGDLDLQRGLREIIVGTGGGALATYSSRAANSEAIDDSTWGVLLLTLHAGSYDWQFVPVAGGSFTDSGSASCH